VEVKLYQHEGELYVLAKSGGRQAKEIAMRRKRLARLVRSCAPCVRACPNATSCCCASARPRKKPAEPSGL